MKKWPVEKQVLAGFAFSLAALLLTGFLAYRSASGFIRASDAAIRAEQTLTALEGVSSLMSQAESLQRRYLLLGEEVDLAGRAQTLARIEEIVAGLRRLNSDNPGFGKQLLDLDQRIAARLRLLEGVLEVRRTQGFAAARERLRLDPGRREMAALLAQIDLMKAAEKRRLEQLRDAARKQARQVELIFGFALLFTLGILTLLYGFIRRQERERRLAESALAEQSARLSAVVETAVDAIITIDERGIIDSFNPAAERLFGHARGEALGKNVSMLMPAPYREAHDGYLQHYAATGERRVIGIGREVMAQRRDGSTFPIELAVSEMQVGGQRMFTGLIHDISQRKEAEERQARLISELESANGELKNFAYVVSHDLKAPLRAIGSLADWIATDQAEKIDADGKEHLRLLIQRVRRMDGLIDGILQYSRVGRVRETVVEVDLNQIVQEALALLAPPSHIRVEVAPDLPVVHSERTRMLQLFQNLLSNAIKYLDKPAGLIKIDCVAHEHDWEFSVSDNGMGIEPRHFKRIFQLFQTLVPKDRVESTGVGLALVKKIVELYGGRVWVESRPGAGSVFYFTLPKTGTT